MASSSMWRADRWWTSRPWWTLWSTAPSSPPAWTCSPASPMCRRHCSTSTMWCCCAAHRVLHASYARRDGQLVVDNVVSWFAGRGPLTAGRGNALAPPLNCCRRREGRVRKGRNFPPAAPCDSVCAMRFVIFPLRASAGSGMSAPALAQNPSSSKSEAAKPAPAKPAPQKPQGAKPSDSKPSDAKAEPPKAEPPKVDATLLASARTIAGNFLLSSADGARACAVMLQADRRRAGASPSRWPLDSCAVIPFCCGGARLDARPSGAVRLLGQDGRTIAEFTEATGGSYEALREGDGVYFLAPPGGLAGIEAPPEEFTWRMDPLPRPRRTFFVPLDPDRCTRSSGRKVEVAPGCTAPLSEFAPTIWRIEGGNVVINSGGQSTLRFARQEDGTWAKTPERGRPLHLARP